MPELHRRDFLRLVGLGAGAAATAACSDPIETLVPYVIQPEEITPGIAVEYSSTCRECSVGCGLRVRTREARPIKLEGNPEHPVNRGALCARGQAGIGRTYHPDRYAGPMLRGSDGKLAPTTWDEAIQLLGSKLQAARGKTRVVGADRGPTVNGMLDAATSGVGGQRLIYEPFAQTALRAATREVFGRGVLPIFEISGADLVLDFGSDFLDGAPFSMEMQRQLTEARDLKKHPEGGARIVSFGPRMSATVSNADQWVASRAGAEGEIALALAARVAQKNPSAVPAEARSALAGVSTNVADQVGVEAEAFDTMVDLVMNAKHAVALPPSVAATGPQATATASAVLLLNVVLGAVGSALTLPEEETARTPADLDSLRQLVQQMNGGQVDVLLVHDSNPLYSLPGGLGFGDALKKVGFVVSFAALTDETSQAADLILPDLTPLESWGDAEPRKGVRSLQQPTIKPLMDGRAIGEVLLAAARAAGATALPTGTTLDLLKAKWSDTDFRKALDVGGVFSETPKSGAAVRAGLTTPAVQTRLAGSGDYDLIAFEHPFLGDGSGAALPWLQETPDPVTKASWVSWAEVHPDTAEKLGVGFGDVIRIDTGAGAGSIAVPVYPRGGVRQDVVAVATGQGHTEGLYASHANDGAPGQARGANVLSVLPGTSDAAGATAFLSTKASLSKTGAFSRIPLQQWTDNQRGRGLAPDVTPAELAAEKGSHMEAGGGHHFEGPPFEYQMSNDANPDQPYRWGMTIDNDKCTGCGACVVACAIENNVPVVGQSEIDRRRDMSWIRIERYVGEGTRSGGYARRPYPDSEELGKVDVRNVTMMCQHCGAAPCEAVCPVIATYHTDEGINGMVYNRCVGTRYCANNCTYKVRRFNYFDYSREKWPGMLGLMLNPEVTVRGQGVMEKCSFCVQRIHGARQGAKDEGRDIRDGEVQTACQQSCASQAIVFGNSKDPNAKVMKRVSDNEKRSYHSLQILNTRPAITYLKQVRRLEGQQVAGSHHGESHEEHAEKGGHS